MAADMQQLNRITRRRRALITRCQALGAGLTDAQITWLLRRELWVEIRPNVYAVAGSPASWEQAVLASILSAGPDVYASHRTTASLCGFRAFDRPEAIEVVAPLHRKVGLTGVIGHRSRELFDADLTTRLGIPSVTASRALVDLAGTIPPRDLGATLDDLLRRRLCTLDEVGRCVARLHPGPGRSLRAMHRVLGERLPGYDPGDSDLEIRALRAIAKAGLPLPKQQYRMRLAGRQVRIDVAYPDERIAIEIDSWEHHGLRRSKFDADHIRRDDLLVVGWSPFTFTSAMTDAYFVDCVRALLEAAWHRTEIGRSGVA
jgi:hypothetical protein